MTLNRYTTGGAPLPVASDGEWVPWTALAARASELAALDAIPTATIQTWVRRGFVTILPLARAALAWRDMRDVALQPVAEEAPASSARGGPARENAETADRALEVERLRGELEELQRILRAPGSIGNKLRIERLRRELADAMTAVDTLTRLHSESSDQLSASESKCRALEEQAQRNAGLCGEEYARAESAEARLSQLKLAIEHDTTDKLILLERAESAEAKCRALEKQLEVSRTSANKLHDTYAASEAKLAAVRQAVAASGISDARADDAGRLARTIRTILRPAAGSERCDECDPSFGCFAEPAKCCKRPAGSEGGQSG